MGKYTMCQFVQNNWKELLGFGIAIAGIWRYLDTRRRELAWRRTEFLFEQARLLDSDQGLRDAVRVLEGRHPDITLDTLFNDYNPPGSPADAEIYQQIDALLNFLDRVAYALQDAKTLSGSEASHFGWYAKQVVGHQGLKSYCDKYGYESVLIFAEQL
jgi:hypothetical protein